MTTEDSLRLRDIDKQTDEMCRLCENTLAEIEVIKMKLDDMVKIQEAFHLHVVAKLLKL